MRQDISGWSTRITDEMIDHYVGTGQWPNRPIHLEAWTYEAEAPDRIAIFLEDGNHITYGRIVAEARRIAAGLQKLGLKPGEVVSFQMPNWWEAAAINIAVSALGLVINPIVPIYRGGECAYILEKSHTRVMVIPESYRGFGYGDMLRELKPGLPELDHVVIVRPERDVDAGQGEMSYDQLIATGEGHDVTWPEVDPNAIKLIMYTSGTTGFPKGVLHTHNTFRGGGASRDYWQMSDKDVMLMASPVTHVTGFSYGLELPFVRGTASALMERWDALAAVDYINETGSTMTVSATPFLQELIQAVEQTGKQIPTFRLFGCGGAAVPPDLVRKAQKVLPQCKTFRVYGASEIPLVSAGFMEDENAELCATTDGMILNWEVKIADDDGNPLPHNTEGEILARGPAMMAGYADPEQNSEAFDHEGYFRSGDLGVVTDDNAILVTGRKKDLIIRGGENLSAKEIEDALHKNPKVAEAAVISMPHKRLGEGVCAYVIPKNMKDAPTLEELVSFVNAAGLAKQKFPERLEVVDDLPRTPSGKVQKHILRKQIKDIVETEWKAAEGA